VAVIRLSTARPDGRRCTQQGFEGSPDAVYRQQHCGKSANYLIMTGAAWRNEANFLAIPISCPSRRATEQSAGSKVNIYGACRAAVKYIADMAGPDAGSPRSKMDPLQ
jgi:hypothetical protein